MPWLQHKNSINRRRKQLLLLEKHSGGPESILCSNFHHKLEKSQTNLIINMLHLPSRFIHGNAKLSCMEHLTKSDTVNSRIMLFNYVLFLYEENVGFIWYHLAFFFWGQHKLKMENLFPCTQILNI